MQRVDVLIVGAGMAGAALAWRLALHTKVLLLEREAQPGYHSTGRSAALFMETYGSPQMRALTRASRAFYSAPPAGFATAPVLSPRGVLYLATTGQADLLAHTLAEQSQLSPQVQALDAGQVLNKLPALRPECVLGAVWDPDAFDIDVHTLHQGYLRGLRTRGGELRCHSEVLSAKPVAGGGYEVTLAAPSIGAASAPETIHTAVLVNAAGAWADELARRAGVAPIGITPCRRSAFTFAPPAGMAVQTWPAVVGVDESWYFKPDAGRLLGSPANADPTVPHDVQAEALDIATGIANLEAVANFQISRPLSTWAGLRSFAPDHDIVIGFEAATQAKRAGFFWLAGQGGCGIQSAAGAAELAAALIEGSGVETTIAAHGVSPQACSPGRFR